MVQGNHRWPETELEHRLLVYDDDDDNDDDVNL
jgi:hypothetical protein